jgi:hypothetical protein
MPPLVCRQRPSSLVPVLGTARVPRVRTSNCPVVWAMFCDRRRAMGRSIALAGGDQVLLSRPCASKRFGKLAAFSGLVASSSSLGLGASCLLVPPASSYGLAATCPCGFHPRAPLDSVLVPTLELLWTRCLFRRPAPLDSLRLVLVPTLELLWIRCVLSSFPPSSSLGLGACSNPRAPLDSLRLVLVPTLELLWTRCVLPPSASTKAWP